MNNDWHMKIILIVHISNNYIIIMQIITVKRQMLHSILLTFLN